MLQDYCERIGPIISCAAHVNMQFAQNVKIIYVHLVQCDMQWLFTAVLCVQQGPPELAGCMIFFLNAPDSQDIDMHPTSCLNLGHVMIYNYQQS